MIRRRKVVCSLVALAMASTIVSSSSAQTVRAITNNTSAIAIEEVMPKSLVTLIEGNSDWKYEDTNTDMYSAKFQEKSYDSTSWKTGKAPLGYPATDYSDTFGPVSDGTLVNSQSKPNAIITYYFTKDFNVSNKDEISKLEATVGIDDGFVIYINGTEVNRTYMDEGDVTHSTSANYVNEPSSNEGTVKLNLTSAKDLLVDGSNKIAVSVHNRDGNSSDIYFDMNLIATYGGETETPEPPVEEQNENKIPKQLNVHMGDDPSSQVNVTYTTIDGGLDTTIMLNKVGSSEKIVLTGENSVGNANKYFHKIGVNGLEANTQYEYTVGSGENSATGTFKTAPAKGSKETIKFAYIADTQVSNATNAKALGATLAAVNELDNLDFVYLAGDITDTSTNESQWEFLFNNSGAFPNGGQEMFSSNLISAVQGNHDNNTLTRHINAPADAGNIVYSYDFGPATFIMLNLEAARYDAEARDKQKEYLISVVNEAKDRGQWTFVGFHKSLYTGASHITDSDAIEARKYWVPVFSELDVDVVMQGHDHVYSRGFVTTDGYNANPEKDSEGKVINPENAPLYMVGGHAGGLKWYSKKNYTVGEGDPLAPGYSFLDVNSTDTGSDVKKEQVIVEVEVSDNELTVNSYMFKYDTTTDTITTEKYLYDTMTAVKYTSEYQTSLGNVLNVEGKAGVEFKVPVSVNTFPTNEEIRSTEMVFDIPEDLEVKNVELNNKVIKADNWDYNVVDGKLRVALANLDDSPIFVNGSGTEDKNIANITFALKEDKSEGDSTKIQMSQFTFRCENDVDLDYDTSKAVSTVTFTAKEVATAAARELYISEGTEVIPENMKAVAVDFTLVSNTSEVKFGDVEFFYSPEFSEKSSGSQVYIALVPVDTTLESLSDIASYTITEKDAQANTVVFGDMNNDGIDAQDALVAVTSWLRKTDLDNKGILTINVNADGKVNTRDAINIVDNFVSGKAFNILSK